MGEFCLHYVRNFEVCKLCLLGALCLQYVPNFAVCKLCLLGDLCLHYVGNFAVCKVSLLGDLCTPSPNAASNITTMAVPSPRPLCSGHVGEATLHQSAQLVFARRQEAQGKEWDADNRQMLAAPSFPPEVRSCFPGNDVMIRKIRSAQWVYWQKGKSLWTATGAMMKFLCK